MQPEPTKKISEIKYLSEEGDDKDLKVVREDVKKYVE